MRECASPCKNKNKNRTKQNKKCPLWASVDTGSLKEEKAHRYLEQAKQSRRHPQEGAVYQFIALLLALVNSAITGGKGSNFRKTRNNLSKQKKIMNYLPLFALETWILLITLVCLFVMQVSTITSNLKVVFFSNINAFDEHVLRVCWISAGMERGLMEYLRNWEFQDLNQSCILARLANTTVYVLITEVLITLSVIETKQDCDLKWS